MTYNTKEAQAIHDEFDDKYELWYVDYRDEMPEGFYAEWLSSPPEDPEFAVEEMLQGWVHEWEMAREVVHEAARQAGYHLSSPTFSLDEDDYHALIETVLERNTNTAFDALRKIAARDRVVIGVTTDDEYYEPWAMAPSDLDALEDRLMAHAGLQASRETPEWVKAVVGQGSGVFTMLVVVSGDEIIDLALDAGVHKRVKSVELVGYDYGLYNPWAGGGWIETLDHPLSIRMDYDEFRKSAWIDNDPSSSRYTWNKIVGGGHPYGGMGRITGLNAPAQIQVA